MTNGGIARIAASPPPQHAYDLLTRAIYAGYVDYPEWGISLQPAKHEPLINFETFQTIQRRLKGNAKVPARKDINLDFPLRGFVNCGCCGKPYQGCWSKGRNRSYAYYLCATKGCEQSGKSVARDRVEGEFATLLGELRPSATLLAMAHDMFRNIWDRRLATATAQKRTMRDELKRLDQDIEQLVDRVMAADSETLIGAYEKRIRGIEERKAELNDRLARSGAPVRDFTTQFRTAMAFLANPSKLWLSENIAYQRIVLKLAFADRLTYVRNEGFRTAVNASPFSLLQRFKVGSEAVVELKENSGCPRKPMKSRH